MPGDRLLRRTLASTSAAYANLLRHLDRLPESLALLAKADRLLNTLAAEQPNNIEHRRLIAYIQFYLAGALFVSHDEAGGQAAYARAASSMQTLLSIDPSDAKTPLNFGFMLMRMAGDMKKAGDLAGAENAARQAPCSASWDPFTADGFGGLYIVDGGSYRIRRVSASGIITTIMGTGDPSSPVEGPAVASPILSVYDLAVNSAGTLFIADSDGMQTLDRSGNLRFAVTGQAVPHVVITAQNAPISPASAA